MTFLLRRRSTDPGHGNGPLGNTSRRPAATDADIAGMLFHPPSSPAASNAGAAAILAPVSWRAVSGWAGKSANTSLFLHVYITDSDGQHPAQHHCRTLWTVPGNSRGHLGQ